MFTRTYVRSNILTVSLLLFIVIYFSINIIKPNFLYDKDSTLRDFGIGYRKKTVLPISIISIILAILSYFFVLYYITIPRIRY